MRICVEREV